MKPIYENIDVAINRSIKVETYTHSKTCQTISWHIHPEYELTYVKNGSGRLRIGSAATSYSDGALLFLGPNIPHANFGNKEYSNNSEVVIQFTEKFVEEKLTVFPEFRGFKKLFQSSNRGLVYSTKLKNSLAQVFEKINSNSEAQKLIHLISILEKLSETTDFKTILPERNSTIHKTVDVTRLETIFQYVNENYKERIRIETLASNLGFTQNSFCRFFKKMTHKTFIQFVNEFRVRKAVEFFNERQTSIAEVMYLSGFNDPSYFTKQFKKYQGVTPSTYQR